VQDFLLFYIICFVMLVGLVGVFAPILPGIELVWLAALAFGILHGFGWTGALAFAVITILFLIGISSDIWITGLGLKAAGTSLLSVFAGMAALVVGSLLFSPLVGILLGLLVLAGIEYARHREWKKAIRSAGTAVLGCGVSYGFKFAIGLAMMGVWLIWFFVGK
jgi:uncharacterized protein YqgC (DUF456 family)